VALPGRFIETTAGRVFVYRAGQARAGRAPLVLLHGYMLSHHSFQPILSALAAEHEVIALDLPGFGESDRPPPSRYGYDLGAFAGSVDETLRALGVERAAVMGHSMGGGVALTLAARRPERVERLVLMAAAVYPLPLPVESRLFFTPMVGAFLWKNGASRADMRRVMRRDDVRDPQVITEEYVDYYWARFNRAGAREASLATLSSLSRLSNNTADPGRVRAPTLLVWGDEDKRVPLSHGKRLSRAIVGAELRVVPACGHLPHLERTDELLRQVVPFLSATPPAAVTTPVLAPRSQVSQ
jgi:pimeloyl-ACP methyl ester carboxylesterase